LSLERVIKALVGLGLSRSDAEVYVYLAKKGPRKVEDLAKALIYNKHKIYASIKNLQNKGLVSKRDSIFSALPFEEALDLLIKKEKEQTQVMHESKEELLTTWEIKD
jgi:sugar-specific transcriptional regulator TrmB